MDNRNNPADMNQDMKKNIHEQNKKTKDPQEAAAGKFEIYFT
jgi:hypothetical protein